MLQQYGWKEMGKIEQIIEVMNQTFLYQRTQMTSNDFS
jgi:hypothetical protein